MCATKFLEDRRSIKKNKKTNRDREKRTTGLTAGDRKKQTHWQLSRQTDRQKMSS